MAEIYGEREGTRRMTYTVIQSQIDWGMLDRSNDGKILTRNKAFTMEGPDLVSWMTRAVLEAVGRPVELATLEAQLVIYPFGLGENLGFVLSSATDLELSADSSGSQNVTVRVEPGLR